MSAAAALRGRGARRFDLGSIDRIPPGEGQTFVVRRSRDRRVPLARGRGVGDAGALPAQGGLLADGIVGDGQVICPLHSYKFDLGSGAPVRNECASLRTYRTEITAGPSRARVGRRT